MKDKTKAIIKHDLKLLLHGVKLKIYNTITSRSLARSQLNFITAQSSDEGVK